MIHSDYNTILSLRFLQSLLSSIKMKSMEKKDKQAKQGKYLCVNNLI